MFNAHRIGRLFGVEVRIHGTMLILAAVVALGSLLSSGLAGAIGSLLLIAMVFGSVTLHELGHVAASALFGGRTLGVTLYPFGGVAQLTRESRSGFEEIVVALAGPAVNFILAGLASIPLLLFGPVEPFVAFAGVNLALGLFNLIPAFPMDGGRVFRGALWKGLGRRRATEIAARSGRWFALPFAALGLLWNPMLLLIAAFVWLQATHELNRLSVEQPPAQVEAVPHPSAWGHPVPDAGRQVWVVERIHTPGGVVLRWSSQRA